MLVLEDVQDPHNLGAIVRSSLFFGVKNILVPSSGASPLSPAAHRASAGALEFVRVMQAAGSLEDWLRSAKKDARKELHFVGTAVADIEGGRDQKVCSIQEFASGLKEKRREGGPSPCYFLLLGNEGKGLSRSMLSLCDTLVHIPKRLGEGRGGSGQGTRRDTLESLNVSVATGILLYQLSEPGV